SNSPRLPKSHRSPKRPRRRLPQLSNHPNTQLHLLLNNLFSSQPNNPRQPSSQRLLNSLKNQRLLLLKKQVRLFPRKIYLLTKNILVTNNVHSLRLGAQSAWHRFASEFRVSRRPIATRSKMNQDLSTRVKPRERCFSWLQILRRL